MQKVVIFGLTQFAELMTLFLKDSKEYQVCGYTVNQTYIGVNTFEGLPVVPFEEVENYFPPHQFDMFICMGYNQMNQSRKITFDCAKAKGYHIATYIHPSAIVLSPMGEGCIVMEGAVIGAYCKIGKSNIFWPASHVAHHTEVNNFNFFTISVAVAGNIHIGDYCFFGNNCTIRNGITIGDRTLVGAGCYISSDTMSDSVHVPARSVCLEGKKSIEMKL